MENRLTSEDAADLQSLDIEDLPALREAVERRGKLLAGLAPDTPVELLRRVRQDGRRLQQRLLLHRALLRAELERLNIEASLLHAIAAQTSQPAGSNIAPKFF